MQFRASTPIVDCTQMDQQTMKSLLVVAATGLGKTVIMGGLARSWPNGRVMMISHRYELNTQAIKSFEWICGEDVDLEQAHFKADQRFDKTRIVVASVQTLNSTRRGKMRMERFDPEEFGLLLIDEAHRSAAASYRRVIEYMRQNPDLVVVGVTATPDRLDGVGLGCVYEKVSCNLDMLWGVKNGWLVSPRQVIVTLERLDLSQIRTVGGDLDEKQLAKVVMEEENLHGMAKPIVDFAGKDKQSIVFAASVAHAQRLSELIRDYYIRAHGPTDAPIAVSIDGSMNPQHPDRIRIVKEFKEGKIQFLCNCGVATEGFDAPNVRLVAIGRPTKSRAMYTQMIGRGTRPLVGVVDQLGMSVADRLAAIAASDKKHVDVLDFIGQSSRHKLVCTASILAGDEPDDIVAAANRISSAKDFDGSTLDAIEEAKEAKRLEQEARRKKVTVGVEYRAREQSSEVWSLDEMPKTVTPGFLKHKRPSDKQTRMLTRLGFTTAQIEKMTVKEIAKNIDYAIRNPRTPFAKWLLEQKRKNGEL